MKMLLMEGRADRKTDWNEFQEILRPLVEHPAVQSMKDYPHHGITSCYRHCMHVAFYNYKVCKLLGLDAAAAARAGLLHDQFLYDWHKYVPAAGSLPHGFTHSSRALKNADHYFQLSDLEKDIIAKHMFPLTLRPPRYKESWVIVLVDKYCSLIETLEAFVVPYLFLKKLTKHAPRW